MAVFDQRDQKVTHQYNIAGDLSFKDVGSKEDLAKKLAELQTEFRNAAEQNLLSPKELGDLVIDFDDAKIELTNTSPNKNKLLTYVEKAKVILNGVSGASSLIDLVEQCSAKISHIL